MGLGYWYRGTLTRNLYSFDTPLRDSAGHPVVGGQWSTAYYDGELYPAGEYVIYANRDGSVAMPTAGAGVQVPSSQTGIGMVTLPSVDASPWERVFVEQSATQENGTLPSGLPMGLG